MSHMTVSHLCCLECKTTQTLSYIEDIYFNKYNLSIGYISNLNIFFVFLQNNHYLSIDLSLHLKPFLTLSMMVAALDALTVMDTTARVIPTAATTNT